MARFLESLVNWLHGDPIAFTRFFLTLFFNFSKIIYGFSLRTYLEIVHWNLWLAARLFLSLFIRPRWSLGFALLTYYLDLHPILPFMFTVVPCLTFVQAVIHVVLIYYHALSTAFHDQSSMRRPYDRTVFRRLLLRGIMPVYTFRDQAYKSMGYTVDPGYTYIFLPRSMLNACHLRDSILWSADLLFVPWGLLRGRLRDVPRGWIGDVFGFLMVVTCFIGPFWIVIACIHMKSWSNCIHRLCNKVKDF